MMFGITTFTKTQQHGNDLGQRMANAFKHGFENDYKK